jgi:hypothetical protein
VRPAAVRSHPRPLIDEGGAPRTFLRPRIEEGQNAGTEGLVRHDLGWTSAQLHVTRYKGRRSSGPASHARKENKVVCGFVFYDDPKETVQANFTRARQRRPLNLVAASIRCEDDSLLTLRAHIAYFTLIGINLQSQTLGN